MKQLLNHIIDEIATAEPDAPCFETPKSTKSYESGFHKVTRQRFASAIDGVAWWLDKSLGSGRDFQTLAYFGPWDARYNLLLFGAVKCGYKMVFPSPYYSASGAMRLLEDLECTIVLTTEVTLPIVTEILERRRYRRLDVPELESMLAVDCPKYPFEKTFEQAQEEPLVVLHTSGTTGHPKPIIWTHAYAASFVRLRTWDAPPGFVLQEELICGRRLFSLFPPWASGNLFVSFKSILSRITQVWPVSGSPPSAQSLIQGLQNNTVDVVCLGPAIIEELTQHDDMVDFLSSNVEQVYWAGGGISKHAGQTLAHRTTLYQSYGSAESGMAILLRPAGLWDTDEWRYVRFHPRYGIEFRPLSENLFEAVLVRTASLEDDPTIFKVHTHLEEWSTQDIFSPHPVKPGLWCHHSRVDDVLVFSNGHKFNPGEYEQHLVSHPEVRTALMVGTRRPQSCLLIEPETGRELSEQERDSLVDRIWPVVGEANEACTQQARIKRSHILFTSLSKPLPRADKGTLKRAQALELYREEFDLLYASMGEQT